MPQTAMCRDNSIAWLAMAQKAGAGFIDKISINRGKDKILRHKDMIKDTEFPSTIRFSLYAGLFIIVAILVISSVTSLWGLQRAVHYLERADHSYGQLAQVSTIESKINQFLLSEIANSVNFQNRENLIEASPQIITEELGELQQAIQKETDFVKQTGTNDNIQEEIDTAIQIASVFIRMHLAAAHETKQRDSMESADAVRSFFTNVVEGNDKQLSEVIRNIVKGEQEEVKEVKEELTRLTKNISLTTATLAVITTLGIIGMALFLARSIVVPVQILATGAERVGAGQLNYRIELPREDEFGLVASRFNKMAGELETQQNLLRSANERLELAVKERTSELEQSNNRLHQIDETRRKFFSNVSHELRTPVTVLLGEAEVALRSGKATLEDMKQAMKRIVANGAFLRRRLNDLLSLARSDDGEIKLELKEAVLNEVVEEAVETASAYAEANDVNLNFITPGNEDFIANIDESWFRQCVQVLIDNAVKFSKPDDTITVTVKEQNGQALIEVLDEGPGIEEEALPHIFDRYYQAKEGQKREGTGLGLAIAHWIVTGHGGQIWAENRSDNKRLEEESAASDQPQTGAKISIKVNLI